MNAEIFCYEKINSTEAAPHTPGALANQWQESLPLEQTALWLGFSLGGLLAALQILESSLISPPKRLVLLAPAISLRPTSHLIRFLAPLPSRWTLPSKMPKEYQLTPSTSLLRYRALFCCLDRFRSLACDKARIARLRQVPTEIWIHPHDPLVSPRGIARWLKLHRMEPNWRLNLFPPAQLPLGLAANHLIVDRPSLGKMNWDIMTQSLERFLEPMT